MSFGLNFVWTSCLTTVKILLDMAQFYSDIADDQLLSAALYKGYLIDSKQLVFSLKSVKKSVKRGGRVLSAHEPHTPVRLSLCFQPRSRPFF